MKNKGTFKINGLIFVLLIIGIIMCGCGNKKEYVFPNELLKLMNETPQIVVDGIGKIREYLPESTYGDVYINSNGELCYLLSDNQRNNWLKRSKDNLEAISMEFKSQGKIFDYGNDYKTLRLMILNNEIDDPNITKSIDFYVSGVLTTQFFYYGNEELELEVTILNEKQEVIGVVNWPLLEGYFNK